MHARAIRALIRKEEDIILNLPNNTDDKTSNSTGNVDKNDKSKVNKVKYEEKLVENTLNNDKDEEEDVVLVVKPTPTIYLLSSDDDEDDYDDGGGGELEDKNKSKNNKEDNVIEDKTSKRVVSLDQRNDKGGEGSIKISIKNQITGGKNIIMMMMMRKI